MAQIIESSGLGRQGFDRRGQPDASPGQLECLEDEGQLVHEFGNQSHDSLPTLNHGCLEDRGGQHLRHSGGENVAQQMPEGALPQLRRGTDCRISRIKASQRTQLLLHPGEILRQRQLHQPLEAQKRGRLTSLAGAKQADIHSTPFAFQARPSHYRKHRVIDHSDAFRQIATTPSRHGRALPTSHRLMPGRRITHGLRRRLRQSGAGLLEIAACHEGPAIGTQQFEAQLQVGGHSLGAPSLFRDRHSVALRQKPSEVGKERSPLRLKFANDFRHLGRKGHQFPSQRFGQRPEQFLDLGFAQPGHRPLQDSSPSPLGQGCGQLHGDTVVSLAGRIRVHQRHHLAIDRHAVGEGVLIEMQVFAAGDLRLGGT